MPSGGDAGASRGARTPVAVSWSGGKDSALALERLLGDDRFEVVALLTTVSSEFDRISIHGIRRRILLRQADELRLPLAEVRLGSSATNQGYEAAFADGLARLRASFPALQTIAFGDLFLQDVREYRQGLLTRLGWQGLYPLWGEPTPSLARQFIARGYRAVLTCVDTTQLAPGFAGREFDDQFLADLPASVDPCGERGEFHTCVYAGPVFRVPIRIQTGAQLLREGRFQYCDVTDPGSGSGTAR